MIYIKSKNEIDLMRTAGKVIANLFEVLERAIKPGVTTLELDRIAEEFIIKNGCKPAFKGLYGFPASICTSINEEVVHGIPSLRKLKEGDIISIDLGATYKGYNADAARTFLVGEISEEAQKLIEVTKIAF